jgi:hypothetical protein
MILIGSSIFETVTNASQQLPTIIETSSYQYDVVPVHLVAIKHLSLTHKLPQSVTLLKLIPRDTRNYEKNESVMFFFVSFLRVFVSPEQNTPKFIQCDKMVQARKS